MGALDYRQSLSEPCPFDLGQSDEPNRVEEIIAASALSKRHSGLVEFLGLVDLYLSSGHGGSRKQATCPLRLISFQQR